jgi:hypothetical protein
MEQRAAHERRVPRPHRKAVLEHVREPSLKIVVLVGQIATDEARYADDALDALREPARGVAEEDHDLLGEPVRVVVLRMAKLYARARSRRKGQNQEDPENLADG